MLSMDKHQLIRILSPAEGLNRFPICTIYTCLKQNAREQVPTNIAFMRVRKKDSGLCASHELMFAS